MSYAAWGTYELGASVDRLTLFIRSAERYGMPVAEARRRVRDAELDELHGRALAFAASRVRATAYPPPPTPRVHAWVSCTRTASGVVEIMRIRDNPKFYRVCDPSTETIVFRGTWRNVIDFAAGDLIGPFMSEDK